MALTPEGRTLRGRLAAISRHHREQPELAEAARRQFRAARAEARIRRLLADLTADQRVDLAEELLDGAA
jgi:hypothetical protein